MGKGDKIRGLVTALAAVGARLELAEAENRGLRKRLVDAYKAAEEAERDRVFANMRGKPANVEPETGATRIMTDEIAAKIVASLPKDAPCSPSWTAPPPWQIPAPFVRPPSVSPSTLWAASPPTFVPLTDIASLDLPDSEIQRRTGLSADEVTAAIERGKPTFVPGPPPVDEAVRRAWAKMDEDMRCPESVEYYAEPVPCDDPCPYPPAPPVPVDDDNQNPPTTSIYPDEL